MGMVATWVGFLFLFFSVGEERGDGVFVLATLDGARSRLLRTKHRSCGVIRAELRRVCEVGGRCSSRERGSGELTWRVDV